jgi:DNA-binding Lrp family transcriptional regulator
MDMRAFNAELEAKLISVISHGLPLVSRPYAVIAKQLGCHEHDVIAGLEILLQRGDIKRFGIVVRHRKLGYKANGMVVWDIPDDKIAEIGQCFSQYDFVTLCYQRSRCLPQWSYNLFSMVHGKDREQVFNNIESMRQHCQLESIKYEILFSQRCFKQRGALYKREKLLGRAKDV